MIKITLPSMRPAFSMITAIFVIVIMASVAGFIMNLSGKVVQETTAQYRKEQAILYAKSYTEFAIMAATARDCIQQITANIGPNPAIGDGYTVVVDAQYIGSDLGIVGCANIIDVVPVNSSPGAIVLLDTYVRYVNPDTPAQQITYHRRTLQKL